MPGTPSSMQSIHLLCLSPFILSVPTALCPSTYSCPIPPIPSLSSFMQFPCPASLPTYTTLPTLPKSLLSPFSHCCLSNGFQHLRSTMIAANSPWIQKVTTTTVSWKRCKGVQVLITAESQHFHICHQVNDIRMAPPSEVINILDISFKKYLEINISLGEVIEIWRILSVTELETEKG